MSVVVRAAREDDRLALARLFVIHVQASGHGTARSSLASGLYRKFGFVEEGRLARQYRRQSGALWDAVEMGLLL